MLKKGLIKTCIYEYIDKHDLRDHAQIFQHLPEIYKYLKNHPHHKDLLKHPVANRECSYKEFVFWAKKGLENVVNGNHVFRNLHKQFNSF